MIRKNILLVGKSGFIYGIGNVSTKIAAFLLIPVYTKYLSVSTVGTIALIELMETFLIGIGTLGIFQATWKSLSSQDGSAYSRKIICSGFVGLLVWNFVVLTIFSVAAGPISSFLGFQSEQDSSLIYLILANVLLQFGAMFQLALWQYKGKALNYVLLSLFQFLGTVCFSVYFIIFLSMGLKGAILAKTVTFSIIFILSIWNIFRNYWNFPSLQTFLNLAKFGAPLVFLGLVTPILTVSDRFFLNLYVPLGLIGIYSINYKFGMLINMLLIVPLQRGLLPMIYREGVKDEMKPIYKDILFYYLIIGCLFILGITFFIKPMIGWISSPEYLEAAYVVPFVAAAYLIAGFRPFFTPLVALNDRTDLLGKAAIIGIAVCLALNYLLIKDYGINGAVAATVISYVIFTYSVYYLSKKVEPMNWNWPRIGKVALLTGLILSGVHFAGNQWKDFEMVFGLLGIASFPLLLWAFRIIGEREIHGVKSIIAFVQNRVRKS
jgi:O-antigen/teichoic acid export membrane protein